MAIGPLIFNFVIQFAANYVLSRFSAQDGPRLDNLEAAGGDYGVPMARGYGSVVRVTGAFIAQADIDEDKHKVGSNSALVGAIGGAAAGFMYGGPVGTVLGAIGGGLLGLGAPDQYYYTYSQLAALFLLDRTNDDPCEGLLKIYAGGKLIFDSSTATMTSQVLGSDGKLISRTYKKNKYLNKLTFYAGHTEQTVDPDLAGQQEISETAGYVFSSYVKMKLELEAWGNSFPASEFLVQAKTNESLASAAESICAAANIDHLRDLSSTALNEDILRGYLIPSEVSCWDALKPLMPVFACEAAEVSGQIRFYKRSQFMRSTMTPDDLGAYVYGDSPPQRFNFHRATDLDLPKETALTFIDPDRNYQPNTATSARSEGNAASNVTVSLQLVLTADEGASAAALMHWDAWLGRTALSFTLTDAWNSLAVGYAYGIPFADQIIPYRISRRVRGANGIIEVEALSDESVTYTASVAGSSGNPPPDESTEFADTRLILMDMSILEDAHDDYGYYIVMGGSEPDWPRGAVQVSGDGGTTWVTMLDQPHGGVMGDVVGTLAAGTTTGLDDTLDTTSTLTVTLLHEGMELESATDTELDNWANFAFVGKDGLGEYLQFKTATFVSGTTWNLTNLRRGRKGTDFAIGTHAADEEFALLDEGRYRIVFNDASEWGNTVKFRGVTLHQDGDDAAEQDFTNTGEGKRPYSPVNVEGTWDGSNNLTITWDSRSRLNAGGLGIDDNAEWDVEFDGSPDHTETVVAETATFSAAEQTAAGLTPGDTVTGRVRQTSDVNDGRWREFTIIGPNALTFDTSLTFDETSYTWDAG